MTEPGPGAGLADRLRVRAAPAGGDHPPRGVALQAHPARSRPCPGTWRASATGCVTALSDILRWVDENVQPDSPAAGPGHRPSRAGPAAVPRSGPSPGPPRRIGTPATGAGQPARDARPGRPSRAASGDRSHRRGDPDAADRGRWPAPRPLPTPRCLSSRTDRSSGSRPGSPGRSATYPGVRQVDGPGSAPVWSLGRVSPLRIAALRWARYRHPLIGCRGRSWPPSAVRSRDATMGRTLKEVDVTAAKKAAAPRQEGRLQATKAARRRRRRRPRSAGQAGRQGRKSTPAKKARRPRRRPWPPRQPAPRRHRQPRRPPPPRSSRGHQGTGHEEVRRPPRHRRRSPGSGEEGDADRQERTPPAPKRPTVGPYAKEPKFLEEQRELLLEERGIYERPGRSTSGPRPTPWPSSASRATSSSTRSRVRAARSPSTGSGTWPSRPRPRRPWRRSTTPCARSTGRPTAPVSDATSPSPRHDSARSALRPAVRGLQERWPVTTLTGEPASRRGGPAAAPASAAAVGGRGRRGPGGAGRPADQVVGGAPAVLRARSTSIGTLDLELSRNTGVGLQPLPGEDALLVRVARC